MDHNLIPPFMLRAGSVVVNNVPKIHCECPAVEDHCILFGQSELRILLQINGVSSYFHTRVPAERELHECEKLFLTPCSSDWNPYYESYEIDDSSMVDFEGDMHEPSQRLKHQVLFEDKDDDLLT